MFLCVSKYPPNVIFHNANINVQHANVTNSMNWHNNVEPLMQNSPNAVAFSSYNIVHINTVLVQTNH